MISALARDAGADTGAVDVGLRLAVYVAHQERTAGEHAAYLAGLAGCTLVTDADGALLSVERSNAEPEVALRYGRELTEYEVSQCPPPVARRIADRRRAGRLRGGAGRAAAERQGAARRGGGAGSRGDLGAGTRSCNPGAASDASAALDAAAAGGPRSSAPAGSSSRRSGRARWSRSRKCPSQSSGGPWLLSASATSCPGSGPGDGAEGVSAGTAASAACSRASGACCERHAVRRGRAHRRPTRPARRAIAAVGRVTDAFPAGGGPADHAVSVELRDSGLDASARADRRRRAGFAAIPAVGDRRPRRVRAGRPERAVRRRAASTTPTRSRRSTARARSSCACRPGASLEEGRARREGRRAVGRADPARRRDREGARGEGLARGRLDRGRSSMEAAAGHWT